MFGMTGSGSMTKRHRRLYSPEFKAEVVRQCLQTDKSRAEVCRELGLNEGLVRRWVNQAEADGRAKGARPKLPLDERAELNRLRRENANLKLDVEILRRAAVFFAKETR
jgi:transposase